MASSPFPAPDAEYGSPTIDSSCRFALDHLLRKYGWQVYARRGNRFDTLWIRKGEIATMSDALLGVPHRQVADAEYAEELYLKEKYK